jgi:aspartokinase/homoserine dehydrogenase 1
MSPTMPDPSQRKVDDLTRTRHSRPAVHKFGGASLRDGPALAVALALVEGAERPAVVVVSAFAEVTDSLLALGSDLARGRDAAVQRRASGLRERYESAATAVVAAGPERRRLLARVRTTFEEIQALGAAPGILRELAPASLDRLLASGEDLSARIFAAGLRSKGVAAEYVDAADIVVADGPSGHASPDLVATDRQAQERLRPLLSAGVVPVVPGFIGKDPEGRVVTLGRGGSDLTATLLARALNARAVTLWKDVPGFLTADPRVVPDARVVPQLHLREAAELAYYGAKVLHPRALTPGGRFPIFVRPFARPEESGTEISRRRTLETYPVKALSAVHGQALVTVTGNGMLGVPGIAARTFSALHRAGISISLISQASSEHSICLGVPADQADAARESLLEAFQEEIAHREIDGVELIRDLATLSVVGLGMAGTPGIAARVFSALAAVGINLVAIAQGSSELNISFVVEASQAAESQRRIHDAFQLSKIGGGRAERPARADVVLLGYGQVGRTLARLLAHRSRQAQLRLVGVIDRGGYVFRPTGLSARDLRRLSEAKTAGSSVAEVRGGIAGAPLAAVAALAEHALSRPILVDVTAGETGSLLETAIASGFDLVLANKRPLAGRRKDAIALERSVETAGRGFRFEATVGAGLPILDTYRKLVESGDRVLRIEGCLSGTLGFLLSELEAGRSFSDSLRQAMERGYTESDPREDLSGADVARKALILGRLLDFRGEPGDVVEESLVPQRFRRLTLAGFLDRLVELDAEWEKRLAGARARGRSLRYVARVNPKRISVGLVEVGPQSPFAGLRGTDNQVAFTTTRYRANPLVIQGPGAGLAVTSAGILNDILELAMNGRR